MNRAIFGGPTWARTRDPLIMSLGKSGFICIDMG